MFLPLTLAHPVVYRPFLASQQIYRLLTLSAVEGSKERPLIAGTFSGVYEKKVLVNNGERPALIARNERPRAHGGPMSPNLGISTHLAWDFEEFDRHINTLARGLISLGVKKGDR